MLYNIEVTNYYPDQYKYDMSRFMRFDSTDQMYDILDSTFIRAIRNLPQYGIWTINSDEGKPSLICENIYGYFNYQYWWIIMEINNLTDASDCVAGLNINYPFLPDLDKIFLQLNPRNN